MMMEFSEGLDEEHERRHRPMYKPLGIHTANRGEEWEYACRTGENKPL